jgi:hypothetical protein
METILQGDRVKIIIGNRSYIISDNEGALQINQNDGGESMIIIPYTSNQILIK